MCKKLIYLVSFVLVLGMGFSPAHGQAGLIGYWRFDETSGTIAADSAGGDNDGTLIGDQLEWTAGRAGGALSFPGLPNDACVEFPTTGMSATAGTVTMWGYLADPQPETDGRYFFGHTTQPEWMGFRQLRGLCQRRGGVEWNLHGAGEPTPAWQPFTPSPGSVMMETRFRREPRLSVVFSTKSAYTIARLTRIKSGLPCGVSRFH